MNSNGDAIIWNLIGAIQPGLAVGMSHDLSSVWLVRSISRRIRVRGRGEYMAFECNRSVEPRDLPKLRRGLIAGAHDNGEMFVLRLLNWLANKQERYHSVCGVLPPHQQAS